MKPIKSLKGKRVALLGLGISQIDYVIGKENGKEWDEVWGINSACSVFNLDRLFMMDPASRFLDSDDAGKQTLVMRKMLPELKIPVYTCELDQRVPKATLFPIEEVANATQCAYFNNTVAYALGFAMWNEVESIDLFGIDFSYRNDLHFAEAGRACVEFWLSKMMDHGITVGVSPRSTVLDADVPPTEKLYGYHRLEKPFLTVIHDNQWIIKTLDEVTNQLAKDGFTLQEHELPPEPYKG